MEGAFAIRAGQRRSGDRLCSLLVLSAAISGCTPVRTSDRSIRYVAFGDSATAGRSTRAYVDELRERLDEPLEAFANEGRGGETTGEGLSRLMSLLADDSFADAKVLLYWEGGKDIAEFIQDYDPLLLFSPDDPSYPLADELAEQLRESQRNIELAITAAQDAGLDVYVATYYRLREKTQICDTLFWGIILPAQAHIANAYVVRLNECIRAAANRRRAVLVDVEAADEIIRSDRANYLDCNHLSEQGNKIVAAVFLEAMESSARRY